MSKFLPLWLKENGMLWSILNRNRLSQDVLDMAPIYSALRLSYLYVLPCIKTCFSWRVFIGSLWFAMEFEPSVHEALFSHLILTKIFHSLSLVDLEYCCRYVLNSFENTYSWLFTVFKCDTFQFLRNNPSSPFTSLDVWPRASCFRSLALPGICYLYKARLRTYLIPHIRWMRQVANEGLLRNLAL